MSGLRSGTTSSGHRDGEGISKNTGYLCKFIENWTNLGEQGVDYLLQHETDHDVNHIQFLVNEGGLITACSNDMIHLWNYRQKIPEVVHSVQLNKESVTTIHLPTGSKWLYVGTDKVCNFNYYFKLYVDI